MEPASLQPVAPALSVHGFPAMWGLPSASPFCTKVETWLRMAGIPYEPLRSAVPRGMPKGKLPYIVLDGNKVGDSRFILSFLAARFAVTLDDGLSGRDRAVGHAITRMLEEHLYFVMLQERWLSDDGWEVLKESYFGTIPPVVRQLAPPVLRIKVRRDVWGQGTGRHKPEEIATLGIQDIEAVALILGDQPYLLGEVPRSADATVFAFLASWLWCPIPSAIKDRVADHPALVTYCGRMRDRYFPEFVPSSP
jgi:glutathione S-transferase